MKTKTIEEAAREYAVKDTHEDSWTFEMLEKGFIAGDAHGYARATEQASEHFSDWYDENAFHAYGEIHEKDIKTIWRAAKPSVQKELKEKDERIVELEKKCQANLSLSAIRGFEKELAEKDARILELEVRLGQLNNAEIALANEQQRSQELEERNTRMGTLWKERCDKLLMSGSEEAFLAKDLEERLKVAAECLARIKQI